MTRFYEPTVYDRRGPAPQAAGDGLESHGVYAATLHTAPSNGACTVVIPALDIEHYFPATCSPVYTGQPGDQVLVIFDDNKHPWLVTPQALAATGSALGGDLSGTLLAAEVVTVLGGHTPLTTGDSSTHQPGDLIESYATTRAGALLCDGSSYPAANYPALSSACPQLVSGGTLTVPDLRGRAVIGSGTGSGLTPRTLGQTGGEETHALVVGEMAAHNHGGSTGTGTTGTGTTGTGTTGTGTTGGTAAGLGGNVPLSTGGTWAFENPGSTGTGAAQVPFRDNGFTNATATASHTHTVPGLSIPGLSVPGLSVPALSISSQGGGGAHNNMQPFAVANIFIKT